MRASGSLSFMLLKLLRGDRRRPRPGVTTHERDEIKALQREVKELRRANEILRLASAFFAQAELDRKFK